MSKQTKEVAVKETQAVALSAMQSEMADAFDYSTVEASDLKIPKMLLMQAMSKYVNEDSVCKAGDLVNSVNAEVYGSVREKDFKPVKIVPIHMTKQWVIQEVLEGGKLEFKEILPVTPTNTDWAWTYEENGRNFKRTKCLNFWVMLEKDLGNPMALPHVLTFRSTSFKEGGVIANHFALCSAAKQAKQFRVPMDRFFEIGGKIEKNDKGTFYKLSAKELGQTTEEMQLQCFNWYKQIQAAAKRGQSFDSKVDNSEFATTESAVEETEF